MSAAERMDPYDDRILAAALQYAARGWRVVPIVRGAKRPTVSAWQNAATTDESVIRRWWTGAGRGQGVGIVTGEASGLWVLDVDVSAGKAGDETLADLEAEHGALPHTIESVTGSGGRHILFRWPGFNPGTNAGRLGPGLDVRAEGGQILAPPTFHPSGTAYEWEAEHHPDDTELADAPEWLLRLLSQPIDQQPRRDRTTPYIGPERPGDRWMAKTHFADLLERDGATFIGRRLHREHGEYELWARPGCQADHGDLHTGATLWVATQNLKVHTSAWPGLVEGQNYSKLGYEAAKLGVSIDQFVEGLRADEDRPLADVITATREVAAELAASRPTEPADDDDDRVPGTWEPVDLRAIYARLDDVEQPTVLQRSDGQGLMYRSRLNTIMGESGAGKSWAALLCVVQELTLTDGHVLWVDYEDSPHGILRRLIALGVDVDVVFDRFHYIQPDGSFDKEARAAVGGLVLVRGVTLAVIDSTGEALAAGGANPNSDDDVTKWFTKLPRFLERRLKCTVVLVDHVPKDQENAPKLHAIGSQRKRAAISGTMIRVDVIEAYARGKAGRLKVTVAKDRHGTYPQGSVCAEMHVDGSEDGRRVAITIEPPAARDESTGEVVRPTFLMERISRWLEANPGEHSGRAIEGEVKGKAEAKRKALRCLVDEGYVSASDGARGSTNYRLVTTFREDDEAAASVIGATTATASQRVPPRPDRVPGRGQTQQSTASQRVPTPPYGGDGGTRSSASDSQEDTPMTLTTASPQHRGLASTGTDGHGTSRAVSDDEDLKW